MTTKQNKSVRAIIGETSATVRYLLLGAFVNQLGYFIQAYLIVFMLTRGFDVIEASWGLAVLSGGSIIGTLAGATLSTRVGNRNAIIFATAAMAVSVALVPFLVDASNPIWVWTSSIFVCGVFAQMYRPPAATILSEQIPEENHVMGFSMFRIALNLGGAVGPLIATVLAGISWSAVFWVNALCSLGYMVIAITKLPRDNSSPVAVSSGSLALEAKGSWNTVLKDMKFWAFLWAMFLSSIVFIQFTSTVPVAIETRGFPLGSYSVLLSVYALVLITCELKISSITQRFPSWIPATIGTIVLCLGVASFGLTLGNTLGLILSAVILVSGLMISGPTMFAYPAKFPLATRSKYIGATQSSFSAGNAVGPVIGIFIFREAGDVIWFVCLLLAFVSGALLIIGMRPKIDLRDKKPYVETTV